MWVAARANALIKLAAGGALAWMVSGLVIWGLLIPAIARHVEQPIAWSMVEEASSVSSGLVQQLADSKYSEENLAIIAGLSTAREGIHTPTLERLLDSGERWVVIGGSGGRISILEEILEPFFRTGIRPGTLVLAVHPSHLVDRRADLIGSRFLERPVATAQNYAKKYEGRSPLSLFQGYIRRVRSWSYNALFKVRTGMHDRLGTPYTTVVIPGDPWDRNSPLYEADRAEPRYLELQLETWESFGWFDAAAYTSDGVEAAALQELLERIKRLGSEIIVVYPPESQKMRVLVPQQRASENFVAQLQIAGVEGVRIIDMRDALGENLFYDYAHVNQAGRAAWTEALAERLKAAR